MLDLIIYARKSGNGLIYGAKPEWGFTPRSLGEVGSSRRNVGTYLQLNKRLLRHFILRNDNGVEVLLPSN
ncbi:MAG: hypothetical protein AAB838_02285 [Patescibacteria group bacterium]